MALIFNQQPYTMIFDEDNNAFEGFATFYPEMMGQLNASYFSFKNGQLWRHTKEAPYSNYYGVQHESSITGVFGQDLINKKTWISLMTNGNALWDCPEISTQMDSEGTAGLKQQSQLIPSDFEQIESEYHASFLRDQNSIGGLTDGSQLKGVYIVIKFRVNSPNFVYLNIAAVKYINSPLNNR